MKKAKLMKDERRDPVNNEVVTEMNFMPGEMFCERSLLNAAGVNAVSNLSGSRSHFRGRIS